MMSLGVIYLGAFSPSTICFQSPFLHHVLNSLACEIRLENLKLPRLLVCTPKILEYHIFSFYLIAQIY